MNEQEHESFEMELRRLPPAKLPDDFAERLAAARPELAQRRSEPAACPPRTAPGWRLLRWLVPAAGAAACLVALVLVVSAPNAGKPGSASAPAAPPTVRADDVEFGRQLIGAFETVATLPSGEPVRIRCREWLDEVVLRDTARGVVIEQRTPRLEVIPVRFETY